MDASQIREKLKGQIRRIRSKSWE